MPLRAVARQTHSRWGTSVSRRIKGTAIVGAGVLLLSPDSLLIRLMSMDHWTVTFWRGVCAFLGYLVLLRLSSGRVLDRELWRFGRAGLAIGMLTVVGNVLFVLSIRHTTAAHALVIIASAPVFTAIITRVFTPDPVASRTWVATLVVLVSVAAILFSGSPVQGLDGDLTALAGALSLATLFVVVRRSAITNMLPPLALGALLTALVSVPAARPFPLTGSDVALVVVSGVLLSGALALVMRGPHYLSAPEVSLLMLGETVLGPIWVWAILEESPALQSTIAGAVIVVTLAVHAVLGFRAVTGAPVERRPAT